MRDIYVPVRSHPLRFLIEKACLGVLSCFALALVLRFKDKPPITAVLALVIAVGFLASLFYPRKIFSISSFSRSLFGGIAAWILAYTEDVCQSCHPYPMTVTGVVGMYALAVISAAIYRRV